MGRIDVVVFPNGGREIFGQIKEADTTDLTGIVNAFTATLEESSKPRKFTGYYDAPDASDIEWQNYNEDNPIVFIPVESPMPISEDSEIEPPIEIKWPEMVAVELLSLPEEIRENYLSENLG